ncbi:acyl-CoA dehydrogenase family protein [Streptacidiphilus cavernicola]|uniref:Acyl-CoA dehydrogenase family protein n=1 Tax=Streptacidiphilus cavernicola TaxID=3342716 RepID=A0ABV6VMV2_9ACTN
MHFGFDDRTEQLRRDLLAFMDERIRPAERELYQADPRPPVTGWHTHPVMERLKAEARSRGLWNLFRDLPNLAYAPLAEITGHSPALAPEALNCGAPDTGNMGVLDEFGTPEQKERWLRPLLDGTIRSAFAMTEPDVASSDATNITTRIRRDGGDYVLDGRKWFISGAMNPNCAVFVVMGKTDPDAPRHRQQSMVLVPRDTPGVEVVRPMTAFGYRDEWHGGHAEVRFTGARVPAGNLIAGEGEGFAISQARLGPGRIHHCMRLIGMAERGLELMCRRADERVAFGRTLAEQGVVREWIAESRVRIEQARLLVLKTAWLMDTVGNKGAHSEIQAIKIVVPSMAEWVLDKAIQTHGGGGVSQDFPLAELWVGARALRLADGPDEVHRHSLAKRELAAQARSRADRPDPESAR